ncbi:MAG: hypothetical protein JXB88_09820 [Spirochaetales bacterium]|nr:hypothetical protein [Spirochaetales bacterium]
MAENKTVEKSESMENLRIIKEYLFDAKIRTMYAQWAFFVWGVLVILGGLTHYIIAGLCNLKAIEYFVFIWMPVIVLAFLFELISFIQNMSKYSLTIFSRPVIKFFLGLSIISFTIIFTAILFLELNVYYYIPLFLTFGSSVFFVLYAMITHIYYLIPASILTAIPVILFFFPIPTRILILVCSLSNGIVWIAGGFLCYFLEKKDQTNA